MTAWASLSLIFLAFFVEIQAEVQYEEYSEDTTISTSCREYQDTIHLEPLYISEEEYCNENEESSQCFQNQTEAIAAEEVFSLEERVKKLIEKGKPDKANEDLEGYEIDAGFLSIFVKSAGQKHLGPSMDYFGNGPIKYFYMVEVSVKGRAIYTITNKLEPVHENMRTELISFYEKPTGPFVREVYLCLLRDVVDRWAILGAPCNESKNQYFGFKLYVGSSELNNPAYPSIKVNVANNRKLGMPFGTRVFTKDEDKICCQGGADLIDFKPCCHYRWYPWKFSMPVGWSGWGDWQECSNSCEQIRKRLCLGNKGDCKVFWSKSNKTPWMEKRKCPSCDNRKVATPPPKKNAKKSPKQSNKKPVSVREVPISSFKLTTPRPKTTRTTRRPPTTRRTLPQTTRRPMTTRPVPKNHKGWTPWSQWSRCTRSCGGGHQYRERSCNDGCQKNARTGQYLSWHQEPRGCNRFPCPFGQRSQFGSYGPWGPCSKTCGRGMQLSYQTCISGACKNEPKSSYPYNQRPCTMSQWCPAWNSWGEWSACNVNCGGGKKERRRTCSTGKPGFEGCPGPDFQRDPCNQQSCQPGQSKFGATNEMGMTRSLNSGDLSFFNQECLDYHNFFRALHNLKPMTWNTKIASTAQKWATELKARAPRTPNSTRQRTKNWPHSDSPTMFRAKNVGENIAWDLTENGHPCRESVFRWYAELFYFNPRTPQRGRRRNDPVGHLTQLLWPDSVELGCGTAVYPVKQPPNTIPPVLLSTYTVCHYTPQGNIIGRFKEKWSPLSNKYCSTYNNRQGNNQCGSGFSNCMGLKPESTCGCETSKFNFAQPICKGLCLIYCENERNVRGFWPNECVGKNECRCGKEGAICK